MTWLIQAALAQATDGEVPHLNAQLFRPSIDAPNMLWTDQSLMAPDGYTMGRATLHYVNDPLVYEGDDGERVDLVSGLWQLSLSAGHTRGPLRIGADVPVYLRSNERPGWATLASRVATRPWTANADPWAWRRCFVSDCRLPRSRLPWARTPSAGSWPWWSIESSRTRPRWP